VNDQFAVDLERLRFAGRSFDHFADEVGRVIGDLTMELFRTMPFTGDGRPTQVDKDHEALTGPRLNALKEPWPQGFYRHR
jgi:hypothetical protein